MDGLLGFRHAAARVAWFREADGLPMHDIALRHGAGTDSGRGDASVELEDGVEDVAASHREVAVRFGHMAEAAVEDDSEGDVVEGGVVGRRVSGADAAGVLAEGGVAAAVVAVLGLPVATVPGQQAIGAGALGGRGGNAAGGLAEGRAGLDDTPANRSPCSPTPWRSRRRACRS